MGVRLRRDAPAGTELAHHVRHSVRVLLVPGGRHLLRVLHAWQRHPENANCGGYRDGPDPSPCSLQERRLPGGVRGERGEVHIYLHTACAARQG